MNAIIVLQSMKAVFLSRPQTPDSCARATPVSAGLMRFFCYLREFGVLDAICEVLSDMYKQRPRPADPMRYLQERLCTDQSLRIGILMVQVADTNCWLDALQAELHDLRALADDISQLRATMDRNDGDEH
ncbi:c-Myc-binding protein homolog [Centruroides sculpturatus]|uniref:c-Myc-binding protein homolog n=1 Tax=Centruroides sculpturatus TaxID=218467 RepID=UPI000C6EBF8A|nr:c-Myc-binding protein homolog [Centruroides sculpturatus]